MMILVKICFQRNSFDDGFGFECMKIAYRLHLKGRMDYGPGNSAGILAEGEQENITEFLKWIKLNITETITSLNQTTLNYQGNFSEFDIYRHSA